MSYNTPFEYEERYKVTDIDSLHRLLAAASFVLASTESQIDHWFIPKTIMSPEEQAKWFDNNEGYALRIRQQGTPQGGGEAVITAKKLVNPGDHSAMTNFEQPLTVGGVRQVLSSIGSEFTQALEFLKGRDEHGALSFHKAKEIIEKANRKEYITLDKERSTFRNPTIPNIVIDLDVIPALQDTTLGYSAAVEIEYIGDASLDEACHAVRTISQSLGYNQRDILTKALPGQAIPYLAKF